MHFRGHLDFPFAARAELRPFDFSMSGIEVCDGGAAGEGVIQREGSFPAHIAAGVDSRDEPFVL